MKRIQTLLLLMLLLALALPVCGAYALEDDSGAMAKQLQAKATYDSSLYVCRSTSTTVDSGTLGICYWEGNSWPKSWRTSNSKVVRIVGCEDNWVRLEYLKPGKAKVTVKLQNGKRYNISVKVVDPYAPTRVETRIDGFGLDGDQRFVKSITVRVGDGFWIHGTVYHNNETENVSQKVTFKTSSKRVARITEVYEEYGDAYVQCNRTGSATVTVTANNGKKAKLAIKVVKNKVDNINPRPGRATIKSRYAEQPGAILKSVEFKDANTLVIEYYIINGSNKRRKINIDEITLMDEAKNEEIFWTREIKPVYGVPAYGCKVLKITTHYFEWVQDYDLVRNRYSFSCYDECWW